MMDMIDPTVWPVTEKEKMGLWPNLGLPAHGMLPYLRKIKKPETPLYGIVVEPKLAENSHILLCSPIDMNILGVNGFLESTKPNVYEFLGTHYSDSSIRDDEIADFILLAAVEGAVGGVWDYKAELTKYYPMLRSGGYMFVETGTEERNQAIKDWRRENKVMIPIQMSKNFLWFWQKR